MFDTPRVTLRLKSLVRAALLLSLALPASEAAAQGASEIQVGVGVDPAYTAIFVADHDGLFKKAGLDVKVVQYTQGGDAMDALAAHQLAMAGAAEPTSLIRMVRANIKAIAVYSQSGSYIKFTARPGVSDPKQMKKFGIVPGSVSEFSTEKLFQKYGIAGNDVQLVKAGPPEFPALLARGDVDGYFLWEPWPTIGVKQGGKVLLTSGDVGYVYNMWLDVDGDWLAAHKAQALAFVRTLKAACDIVHADPSRAAAANQAEVKIPPSQTLDMLKDVQCEVRDFSPNDLKTYDEIAQFLVAHKITQTKADIGKVVEAGFYKP
jgi:NitT/TauT family transport system substrate-binding protein